MTQAALAPPFTWMIDTIDYAPCVSVQAKHPDLCTLTFVMYGLERQKLIDKIEGIMVYSYIFGEKDI